MPSITRINHVALAVEDVERALEFWRDTLGMQVSAVRDVPTEQARIAFLPAAESEVELVEATSEDSGIARFMAKRGPGLHHVCLEVDDLEGMLARLKSRAVRLINEEPRTGEGGRRYAFVHPESTGGVLLELYER